jgi:hypothetical protein
LGGAARGMRSAGALLPAPAAGRRPASGPVAGADLAVCPPAASVI